MEYRFVIISKVEVMGISSGKDVYALPTGFSWQPELHTNGAFVVNFIMMFYCWLSAHCFTPRALNFSKNQ